MAFATIEGIAVYALMLYIFRFDFKPYFIPSIMVITVLNLQIYLIETSSVITNMVPLIIIIIAILFMKYFARMPIIGALASGVIGYLAYSIIQFIVILVMYGSLEGINDQDSTRYQIQLVSGICGVLIGKVLYRFGIGFTNDFEKLKYKFERPLVYGITFLFMIVFFFIMYLENLLLAGIFFLLSMVIFLHYAIKKERED